VLYYNGGRKAFPFLPNQSEVNQMAGKKRKRRKMSKGGSKRLFTKTAMKSHPMNAISPEPNRGTIRL
jgi:hypothetical protein